MNPVLSYFLGLITLPILALLIGVIDLLFGKRHGVRGCYVCDRGNHWASGERFDLFYYINLHDLFWSRLPKHKQAWAEHRMNPKHWSNR